MLSLLRKFFYVYKGLTRNAELRKEFATPKVNVHISVRSPTFSFEGTAPNSLDVDFYIFLRIGKAIPVQA